MVYAYIYNIIYIVTVYGHHYLTYWVCGRPNAACPVGWGCRIHQLHLY